MKKDGVGVATSNRERRLHSEVQTPKLRGTPTSGSFRLGAREWGRL